jgi:hypothetical protein
VYGTTKFLPWTPQARFRTYNKDLAGSPSTNNLVAGGPVTSAAVLLERSSVLRSDNLGKPR